jgi:hypothetical protein
MLQVIKDKFPAWCGHQGNHSLILTDDLDSLLSCAIENYVHGYEITQFYSFKKIYSAIPYMDNELIGCDLDLYQGKTWSNHVVRVHQNDFVNPEAANLNAILHVSTKNYFKKYALSTALTMWSYYGLPLPKTMLGKRSLLSIDSGFLGHYNSAFKKIHTAWLEALGFSELINVLNNSTMVDFKNLIKIYSLKSKIYINRDGFLSTFINQNILNNILEGITLPSYPFRLQKELTTHYKQFYNQNFDIESIDHLFSLAVTGRGKIKYSTF